MGCSFLVPVGFVGQGQDVQVGAGGGGVVHPFAQQGAAVDEVDGQALALVFVGEVAPEGVVGRLLVQGLEGQGHESPGFEVLVLVAGGVVGVDLHSGA